MHLHLHFEETVDDNIFLRKIKVENKDNRDRTIRVCFHHDFHLFGDGVGDTAFYNASENAVIHYKRDVYFLVGFCDDKKCFAMADYDIGEHVNPGWQLGKKPIHQGEVDSIVAVDLELPANGSRTFYYYLVAGTHLNEVLDLKDDLLNKGFLGFVNESKKEEKAWLKQIKPPIKILPKKLQDFYKRSLLIIRTQCDHQGAIMAANDSDNMEFNKDTYSYMWPRDGALVATALIKAGFAADTKKFFEFCKDVLYEDGCLLHKYNPDRSLGSSWHPWVLHGSFSLPIQEDETALVLHALWNYYEATKDKVFIKSLYPKLIKPMGNFLANYRYENGLPKESYDLWEERRAIFTFTTAATLAGLIAADKLGHLVVDKKFCSTCNIGFEAIKNAKVSYLYNTEKEYFRRSVNFEGEDIVYDDAMDASVFAITEFGVFDANDDKVVKTMTKMKEWLSVKTDVGGIARYHDDPYMQQTNDLGKVPGNPWFICTLWYAKWVIKKAKKKSELKEALEILNWVVDHALPTGLLPEQLDPFTGEALSVSPLTWSHAEFVDTMTDYVNKVKKL
ncbi:MAG: glycoside hydrolase family 15 protein [Candidatus Woesearchaeota archaeon]|jgi:GH15 family glucan-1,4-alpha-glucosidase|nr:glycoside hydrolase family 15 protein [Candidatus Woesearchaeota archaeon]